jgi:hypothetical protein
VIRLWTLEGRNLTASKISTSQYKNASMPKDLQKCKIQGFLCVTEVQGKVILVEASHLF